MVEFILSQIRELMQAARDNWRRSGRLSGHLLRFGAVFLLFAFLHDPALAQKRGTEIMLWSSVFLCATVAPFLYVLFFGRNLPWWVYGIIALLIGQGVFSLIMKLWGIPQPARRQGCPTPRANHLLRQPHRVRIEILISRKSGHQDIDTETHASEFKIGKL